MNQRSTGAIAMNMWRYAVAQKKTMYYFSCYPAYVLAMVLFDNIGVLLLISLVIFAILQSKLLFEAYHSTHPDNIVMAYVLATLSFVPPLGLIFAYSIYGTVSSYLKYIGAKVSITGVSWEEIEKDRITSGE